MNLETLSPSCTPSTVPNLDITLAYEICLIDR